MSNPSARGKVARQHRNPSTRQQAAAAWVVARDAKRKVDERSAALLSLTACILAHPDAMRGTLKILSDASEPLPLRLTALQVVQAASFAVVKFNQWRPSYLAALRAASEDPDPELRQRVLGVLAREKDARTQQRLLAGLSEPAKALVPPEKALQLLSYDVHADAYSAARKIVAEPPNEASKHEALRLLAADARSAPLFESLLRDKKEPPEVRQISASALHALSPEKLQSAGRDILMDETENDHVRAVSLTALTQFGKADELGKDEGLLKQAQRLKSEAKSEALKHTANQFLQKYQR